MPTPNMTVIYIGYFPPAALYGKSILRLYLPLYAIMAGNITNKIAANTPANPRAAINPSGYINAIKAGGPKVRANRINLPLRFLWI